MHFLKSLRSHKLLTLPAVFFILLSAFPLAGQDLPERPVPPRLVVDYTGTLNNADQASLERKLVRFNDTTSNQLVIILTDNLMGYDIEGYASRVGDKWGVGQAELDNGIVIVVKPKTDLDRGQAFISVGYGLEGVIPDITAGQIVDYEMIPHFRKNNYYSGLDAATSVIMELAAGEYSSDEYAKNHSGGAWKFFPILFFIIMFILIGRLTRRSRTIGSRGMSPWTAFMIGGMMGSAGRGGWGGSSGSSFGGGGGFGGFGGGGFGGGGAGGSW